MTSIQERESYFSQIQPSWNPDLYWSIFVIGFIVDIVLHILAKQEIMGASLMPYYYSLGKLGPHSENFPLNLISNRTFKSWFYGGILAGIAVLVALLLADFLLQIIEWSHKEEK